jgi:hypothetical protein
MINWAAHTSFAVSIADSKGETNRDGDAIIVQDECGVGAGELSNSCHGDRSGDLKRKYNKDISQSFIRNRYKRESNEGESNLRETKIARVFRAKEQRDWRRVSSSRTL